MRKRCVAPSWAFAVSSLLASVGLAHAQDLVAPQGRLILTGGTIEFREASEKRRAAPPAASRRAEPQRDLLDDLADLILGPLPVRKPVARKPAPTLALPPAPQDAPKRDVAPIVAAPAAPATAAPIVTGTIPPPRPDPGSALASDLEALLVRAAEREQARVDLVKLELARRTYDEGRLAGHAVFDTRTDWRVLERSREAFNAAEAAASRSAGFEANAYVNDRDRKIVVAIAGSQDLRRDFLAADIWNALIQAQAPQQFFLAKSYVRSVMMRYQAQGYSTECVGHSLGGAACAYTASELGIRAIVVNPISAGALVETAKFWITNYVVDGDIANLVYGARGNETTGDLMKISSGNEDARRAIKAKFGPLAGPILVVRDIQASVKVHQIDRALDLIAAHAGTDRVK